MIGEQTLPETSTNPDSSALDENSLLFLSTNPSFRLDALQNAFSGRDLIQDPVRLENVVEVLSGTDDRKIIDLLTTFREAYGNIIGGLNGSIEAKIFLAQKKSETFDDLAFVKTKLRDTYEQWKRLSLLLSELFKIHGERFERITAEEAKLIGDKSMEQMKARGDTKWKADPDQAKTSYDTIKAQLDKIVPIFEKDRS